MKYNLNIYPPIITLYLTICVGILTIISTAIQIAKYVYYMKRADWMLTFNMDREMNIPTWYSFFLLAFSALLLKLIAIGKKNNGESYSRYWGLLSLIMWLLALDEVLSVHEILIIPDLFKALNLPSIFYSLWVIPGAIFVIWFLRHFWKFTMNLPKRSRYHFIIAATLYIGGALGMEMVGGYLTKIQGQQHLPYALAATFEEVLEMMGIVVFIYGLLCYIQEWSNDLLINVKIKDSKDSI